MASEEVKQKLKQCLISRRNSDRPRRERADGHDTEIDSPHDNPKTPPSLHRAQLWRSASDSFLKHKRKHSSNCTKCQHSPPPARSDHTSQLWEKRVQPYRQMVIGPVDMWLQHPLTRSHENMLQQVVFLKQMYIEVNSPLPVLQGACVSVMQHRPLQRCQSQPVIVPCGFYQCWCLRRPERCDHKTLPTRLCVIHQDQRHLEAEEEEKAKRAALQEKVKFMVGENSSMVLQQELCGDSSPGSKWLRRPALTLHAGSHKHLTHTHSCPPSTDTSDSSPDSSDSAPDNTGLMYEPQMLKQQCICGNSSCRAEHAAKVPKVFARLQECGVSNQCKWISGKQCSAACVTDLLLRIAQGRLKNGFAIVQPHGPDTSPSKSVVSPVAVAAERLHETLNNRKILILDWDVHHCHTTQKMFYKDPNVLHISLHRRGNAPPGNTTIPEVGLGDGGGFNINLEWSCDLNAPIGDAEYLAAFRVVIRPIAQQFSPEIILISTEFNTAEGHPESQGGPRVSAKCFGLLTQSLMELSGGRVLLVLERGHDHPAVCEASVACVNALLQNKLESLPDDVLLEKPCAAAVQSLSRVLQIHSQKWSSVKGLTHTVGESWLQAERKQIAQVDTDSAHSSLSLATPKTTGVSCAETFGFCGGRNEPVEHDEDEDEDEDDVLL